MGGGAEIVLCWVGSGEQELARALDLRERVFCGEQGVSRAEELDGLDDSALHLVALEPDGEVIGTLRMLVTDGRAKIGRVAVERRLRRRRVASRMLELALHEARERGCKRARLAAQVDAIGLYQAAGFVVESEPFEEAGITHVWMGRALASGAPEDPARPAGGSSRFADRREAGRRLVELLEPLRAEHPAVLGIPRGGMPVAAEAAAALCAPLDVVVVRKVGAPGNREYALGAVAEGGVRVLSASAVRRLEISERELRLRCARAERELEERLARYRGARAPLALAGRTAIVVDDGLATGRSAVAAVRSARERGAARVVLAVPVGAPESVRALAREADEVRCVETPGDMWAVGLWYEDFRPTTDAEVIELLASARSGRTT